MTVSRKREYWLYFFTWTLVFIMVPLVMTYHLLEGHEGQITTEDVFPIWKKLLPYLLLFVLHDCLATPFLTKRQWKTYLAIALPLLGLFIYYALSIKVGPPPVSRQPFPDFPPGELPPPPEEGRPLDPRYMKVVIGILIVMVNVGIKAFFQSEEQKQRVKDLEAQQLSQQLETLRYQINPHFFMNTLNNIHALVDIDPEKAKESIEQFSKLMRIVLYDGNAPTIPLQLEMDYMQHYVSLMRLRYPQEDVDIRLQVPDKAEGIMVPPLLMATFVENAFKHGISYEASSFVHIALSVENRQVVFKCSNSTHPHKKKPASGIGLQNIQNRLNLLYGKNYSLHTEEGNQIYTVILRLPIS